MCSSDLKLQAQLNELLSLSEKCKNNPQLRIHIQTIQMRLKRITEQKVKGAVIRSKARWVEYGEKNTRYFLNLEKRRGEKNNINKRKLNDGTETEDQEVILQEEKNFIGLYMSQVATMKKYQRVKYSTKTS